MNNLTFQGQHTIEGDPMVNQPTFAAHESLELHEILNFKTLCVTRECSQHARDGRHDICYGFSHPSQRRS
ncbi:hypothetical protein QFZ77_004273 [Paenibacillus sp. V4I3]|nr:hypothetical protein [Paenibacillus sp. V4I3]